METLTRPELADILCGWIGVTPEHVRELHLNMTPDGATSITVDVVPSPGDGRGLRGRTMRFVLDQEGDEDG